MPILRVREGESKCYSRIFTSKIVFGRLRAVFSKGYNPRSFCLLYRCALYGLCSITCTLPISEFCDVTSLSLNPQPMHQSIHRAHGVKASRKTTTHLIKDDISQDLSGSRRSIECAVDEIPIYFLPAETLDKGNMHPPGKPTKWRLHQAPCLESPMLKIWSM